MLSTDDLPTFGPGGAEPPLASERVIVSANFFYARLDRSSPAAVQAIRLVLAGGADVTDRFPELVAWARGAGGQVHLLRTQRLTPLQAASLGVLGAGVGIGIAATGGIAAVPFLAAGAAVGSQAARARLVTRQGSVELRRVIYSQRYIRDPVMQIPPGGKRVFSSTRSIGLSSAQTKELAASLGLGRKGSVDISSQISRRIATTVTVTNEQADTSGYEFNNNESGCYQRVACWYLQHEFTVHALVAAGAESRDLGWAARGSTAFTDPYMGQATFAEVRA